MSSRVRHLSGGRGICFSSGNVGEKNGFLAVRLGGLLGMTRVDSISTWLMLAGFSWEAGPKGIAPPHFPRLGNGRSVRLPGPFRLVRCQVGDFPARRDGLGQ